MSWTPMAGGAPCAPAMATLFLSTCIVVEPKGVAIAGAQGAPPAVGVQLIIHLQAQVGFQVGGFTEGVKSIPHPMLPLFGSLYLSHQPPAGIAFENHGTVGVNSLNDVSERVIGERDGLAVGQLLTNDTA